MAGRLIHALTSDVRGRLSVAYSTNFTKNPFAVPLFFMGLWLRRARRRCPRVDGCTRRPRLEAERGVRTQRPFRAFNLLRSTCLNQTPFERERLAVKREALSLDQEHAIAASRTARSFALRV